MLPLIPVVLIALIVTADGLLPSGVHLGPLLAVAPAVAALFGGPRTTAAVGLLALVALVVAGRLGDGPAAFNHDVEIGALVTVTGFVVVYCLLRERYLRELAQVRSASEAAQRVVMRPMPPRVGPLRVASLSLSAAAAARVGGDLYAAIRTEGATRLLIGDVRGKGLAAISDAAVLIYAFREAAHRQATLPRLVERLEASLARDAAERAQTEPHAVEFFITAALVEVPDDEPVIRLVSCGHPPPLLLREGRPRTLRAARPAPPLGMGELSASEQTVETFPFEAGDQLVLYTDGVTEARDRSGAFYPLAERLPASPGGDARALADYLRDDLLAYAGGRLPDDAAILVIERAKKA